MSDSKDSGSEQYKCGDCGITSPALKWTFDWEDKVEDTVWLVCPHCSVRSSKRSLHTDTEQ